MFTSPFRDAGRLVVFSPDTYGLGHLRRCMSIATAAADRGARVLVVTGSPRARAFEPAPGVEIVGLPAVTKDALGGYRPRTLLGDLDGLLHLRGQVTAAAVDAFAPDTVLVDHHPLGVAGELAPLLRRLAATSCGPRLVLGLRDIVDEPARVRRDWDRDRTWDALALYDEVLVYGDQRVGTTATDLALGERLGSALRHVGYVTRPPAPAVHQRRERPLVVATAGGGGDAGRLLRRITAFAARTPRIGGVEVDHLVVAGPLLSDRRRRQLEELARPLGDRLRVVEFVEDLDRVLAGADAAVTMGGYNTVVELVAAGVPALVVPREHPRAEQLERIRRLAPVTGLRWAPRERVDRHLLESFLGDALAGRVEVRPQAVDLDGRAAVSAAVARPRPPVQPTGTVVVGDGAGRPRPQEALGVS